MLPHRALSFRCRADGTSELCCSTKKRILRQLVYSRENDRKLRRKSLMNPPSHDPEPRPFPSQGDPTCVGSGWHDGAAALRRRASSILSTLQSRLERSPKALPRHMPRAPAFWRRGRVPVALDLSSSLTQSNLLGIFQDTDQMTPNP